MWKQRLCCEGIAKRLAFENVADVLYSVSLLMSTLIRHAKSQSKKLQLRKELLRVQELGEDTITENINTKNVEVYSECP